MKKHFKATLIVDGVEHEFHFEKVDKDEHDPHRVTITADQSPASFVMVKDAEGQWNIISPNVPAWIKHAELFIREAILDHEEDKGHAKPPNPWNILGE